MQLLYFCLFCLFLKSFTSNNFSLCMLTGRFENLHSNKIDAMFAVNGDTKNNIKGN